ncbi:hypothetical protein MKZ38_001360 [Zalerion maritima]|uniref:Uncharacterized protein n=1 Tax=Zalerion maritima TaxID=339359 RepID=A0AAD5RQZ7_9PEZI|nr:hypothetical protein MKZ38_001360 [Zalerion maritima]
MDPNLADQAKALTHGTADYFPTSAQHIPIPIGTAAVNDSFNSEYLGIQNEENQLSSGKSSNATSLGVTLSPNFSKPKITHDGSDQTVEELLPEEQDASMTDHHGVKLKQTLASLPQTEDLNFALSFRNREYMGIIKDTIRMDARWPMRSSRHASTVSSRQYSNETDILDAGMCAVDKIRNLTNYELEKFSFDLVLETVRVHQGEPSCAGISVQPGDIQLAEFPTFFERIASIINVLRFSKAAVINAIEPILFGRVIQDPHREYKTKVKIAESNLLRGIGHFKKRGANDGLPAFEETSSRADNNPINSHIGEPAAKKQRTFLTDSASVGVLAAAEPQNLPGPSARSRIHRYEEQLSNLRQIVRDADARSMVSEGQMQQLFPN